MTTFIDPIHFDIYYYYRYYNRDKTYLKSEYLTDYNITIQKCSEHLASQKTDKECNPLYCFINYLLNHKETRNILLNYTNGLSNISDIISFITPSIGRWYGRVLSIIF